MAIASDTLVVSSLTYVAGVIQTLATCPGGEVWILKDLVMWNNTGAVTTLQVQFHRGGLGFPVLELVAAVAEVVRNHPRFIVLNAGDAIRLKSSGAGNVRAYFAGARLEGA